VLENADVHVVNKADRDGADRTVGELRAMLTPDPLVGGSLGCPPVLAASAARDEASSRSPTRSTATWLI